MKINYGGYVSLSTVDWYGKCVGTLFFRGCAVKCKDCQNPTLIDTERYVDVSLIKDKILESKPLISGVVFSGGEPCQQPEALIELIDWCGGEGLVSYIHTSGYFPGALKTVIKEVGGVRLDYKPVEQLDTHERYHKRFSMSLNIVKASGVEYWVSMVALRRNVSVEKIYNKFENVLVVQGNEKEPWNVGEMREKFPGVWIYTRENGLEWNK